MSNQDAGDKKKTTPPTAEPVSEEELRRMRERGREAQRRIRERLKRMTDVEESTLRHQLR